MSELLIYLYPDSVADDGTIEAEVIADRIEGEDEPPMWAVTVKNDPDVAVTIQRAVTAAGFGRVTEVTHQEGITSSPAYTATLTEDI